MALLVWLTAHMDSEVLLGALLLAFVTHTILNWLKVKGLEGKIEVLRISLERDAQALRADMEEMHALHPRQGNPGTRVHAKGDGHERPNPPQRSTRG